MDKNDLLDSETVSDSSVSFVSDEVVPPTPISPLGLAPDVVRQVGTGGDNRALFAPENLRVSQDFVEQANVET